MSKIIVLSDGRQVAIDSIESTLPPNLVSLFSRIRVAQENTEISLTQNTRMRNLLLTEGEVSGSGTSATYEEQAASTLLNVGTSIGLRRLRSRTAGLYVAGNGLLGFMTFNLEENGQNNVTKRIGYFSDSDGFYLRQINGILSFVLRSSVTGSVVEEVVHQSSWGDPNNAVPTSKFDGNDLLGYNFDQTECHRLWFACEWLGVGDVYMGFVNDATPIVANIFRHSNRKDKPYMQTANLFLNYEIERTASGGSSESLRTICATLKSEGSLQRTGFAQTISLADSRTTSGRDVFYVLFLFRLNPSYINARVLISLVDYALTNNADTFYEFRLVKTPAFSGSDSQTWTSLDNSAIQFKNDFDNNLTLTGQEYIIKSFLASNDRNSPTGRVSSFNVASYLGSNFDNTPEEYCLAVSATSNSVTIEKAIIEFWEQI